ncbi:hypothetical protein GCM10010166_20300 [Couchioplanes caeruleus subsp. azureus]|nr:hypothetical protein GCM10010166_20300 [Couchioplanes caeruleus subsp. azureus]
MDSNRSRTGSPRALNIGANARAWSAARGRRTTGAHAPDSDVISMELLGMETTLAEPGKFATPEFRQLAFPGEIGVAQRQNALRRRTLPECREPSS